MGHRIYFLIAIVIGALCLSCNETPDCLKGAGKIIVEEREQNFFSGVTLFDDINLLLVQDTVQKVYVEAGENLLAEISSEVSNQMLNLRNYNVCKYTRSYKKEILTEVHTKNLKYLVHVGSARITSANIISGDYFLIWLNGARGEINLDLEIGVLTIEHLSGNGATCLQGEAGSCFINSTAQGLLDLRDLKTGKMNMQANSYNDAYIWVTDTLDINLLNLGNVFYRGDPWIRTYERKGKGQLIKMN